MYPGSTYEMFNAFDSISYQTSLKSFSESTGQQATLSCRHLPYCTIRMSRAYTPILSQISPQVVYNGSDIAFWVDPRSAQMRQDVVFPELPFYKVLIDGYGVDFEGYLDETTRLNTYVPNQIRGFMGDIVPKNSSQIDFQFRVGYAQHMDSPMYRCAYDNTTCYKAKAVAVIYGISESQGYLTGGQEITVKGHGFANGTIDAKIDGVPCKVFY
jgi:hypothetical protein